MARTITGFASIAALASCALLIGSACSDDEKEGNTVPNNTGSGGIGASSSGGTGASAVLTGGTGNSSSGGGANASSGGGGNTTSGGGTGGGSTGSGGLYSGEPCEGLPMDGSSTGQAGAGGAIDCVGVAEAAEAIPVDMYIMMDRSVSMLETIQGETAGAGDETRWDGVRAAVEQFVAAPEAAGLGVGIQFFGVNGIRDSAENCDASQYATPSVPIGDLPGVGPDITAAIADTAPSTFTPTYPAVQGALQYAADFAATSGRDRLTLVVLVTDGLPTECSEQRISEIAAVAETARQESGVLTFVIGLAAGMWNLEQIAQAGGTGSAYIIQEGDVGAQFLDAILNITTSPLACQYDIPEAPTSIEVVDYDRVQMVYDPATGDPEEIPRLDNSSLCADSPHGGWYYTNPVNPSVIRVCPCTCDRFRAGTVSVRFGCEPRVFSIN